MFCGGFTDDPLVELVYTSTVRDETYISETWRLLGTRLKEHKSEAERASAKGFTWATRKVSIKRNPNKSAITSYVMNTNHVIGWEEASIKDAF